MNEKRASRCGIIKVFKAINKTQKVIHAESKGETAQSDSFIKDDRIELVLPNKLQPFQGDFVSYTIQIDTSFRKEYTCRLNIFCPYFKEKFKDRKNIRYVILLNGEEKFSRFITEIDEDEIKSFVFRGTGKKMCMEIKLECLADEKPWSWGSAARTIIKGIGIE